MQEVFSFEDDFCGRPPTTVLQNDQWINASSGAAAITVGDINNGWWGIKLLADDSVAELRTTGFCFGFPLTGTLRVKTHLAGSTLTPFLVGSEFRFGLTGPGVGGLFAMEFLSQDPAQWLIQITLASIQQTPILTMIPVSTNCSDPDELEIIATLTLVRFLINGVQVHSFIPPLALTAAVFDLHYRLASEANILPQAINTDLVCVKMPRVCRSPPIS